MHIVIVDNGRSRLLGEQNYRNSLKCIRCGSCMNTCPVYRRSGGHSYGSVIPGPIGSIQAPHSNIIKHKDLPFASSLCGSCTDICPVKIDIHKQLYVWRQDLSKKKLVSWSKRYAMKIAGKILSGREIYDLLGKLVRWSIKNVPSRLIYNRLNVWGRERELPNAPKESFKQWYVRTQKNKGGKNGQA